MRESGAIIRAERFLPLNSGLVEIAQSLYTSLRAGKKVKFAISANMREGLETIAALVESGALEPVIDRVYPMDRIAEAHRHVEGRHKRGSVIVAIQPRAATPSEGSRGFRL